MVRHVAIVVAFIASLELRAAPLPGSADLLKRVQARMEAVCADAATNRFHYIRTNVIEELDGSGKLRKRNVKTYEVLQFQGLPRARLLVVDGKALSASEQQWRIAEEQQLQRTLTQDKAPDYSKPKAWLTDDILERFDFKVTGRTNAFRRAVVMMDFKPKADAPNRNMADRIVNKLSGTLWVDELDAEIVRLDLHMTEPVKFWGGILGQLDRFDWSLLRRPSPFGVWYNDTSSGIVQIRKLLSSTRFKISEQSHAFKRERS